MAKAQKLAIQKELLDRATGKGKEPSWENEPTSIQLVKALNFFSANIEADLLKKYAVVWAKKNCPDKVEVIEAQPDWKFQTFGALMRFDSKGLKLPKKYLDSISTFIDGLEMPVVGATQTKPKGKKKMSTEENVNYRNFCDAMDKATEAKEFKKLVLEVDPKVSVAPVVDVCERELASLKEDPTLYPEHMKKWFRAVLKKMSEHAPAANSTPTVLKKAAKPAPAKKTAAKKETPKPVAKAPAKKTAAKPAAPVEAANDAHPLNGKTLAFLFDPRYGRLTRMVAAKGGFMVKGKTIHGIDEKKSKVALLKNFGDAMKPGAANDDLETWMTKCVKKGNPIKVGGRLSEEIVLLNAA